MPRWTVGGDALFFVSNLSGNWEAYSVRVPAAGGEPLWPDRLTFTGDRAGTVCPVPGRPDLCLVLADTGGDERWRILEVAPGGARDLDPGDGVMRHLAEPALDGDTFAFSANHRTPNAFDVYVGHRGGPKAVMVWRKDALLYPLSFSPDGRLLLVRETRSTKDQALWLVALDPSGAALGEPRLLAEGPHGQTTAFATPRWSPNGRTVYVSTNRAREFHAVAAIDVGTAELRVLYGPDADVEEIALSPDGRTLAVEVNVGGASELRLLDTASGQTTTVLADGGVVAALEWAPAGAPRIAFVWDRPDFGMNLFTVGARAGETPAQATRLPQGGIDPGGLVAPREERVTVRDGLSVPAWVMTPPGQAPPHPAVWIVHGGPESQARPIFDGVAQFLVACGITVVKPNVRGSTGYGRSYEHADDVRRRFDSVDDLADLVRRLTASGLLDPARQAVMGGSYGGFMTLSTLTRHPDLWCAGVDIVGMASLVTFLEKTSPWRRPVREAEYGSLEHDRDFLIEVSPITHADRIAAPLLVIHGARDPRVPVEESEQIVETLRSRGRPVEYLRYEDEGHGLTKLKNRTEAYDRVAGFLFEHMARS